MSQPEPEPVKNDWPPVKLAAQKDMYEMFEIQYKKGLETYGTPLQPFNGRDAYNDAMAELADATNYLAQLSMEHFVLLGIARYAIQELGLQLIGPTTGVVKDMIENTHLMNEKEYQVLCKCFTRSSK